MQLKLLGLAGAALGLTFISAPASAGTVPIPIPGTCGVAAGDNCLTFNSFNVYSLALLNLQAGAGPIGPQDPYAVSTNGTALQNALVIGTGVNGAGSINTDVISGGNVDNAYNTPTSQQGTTNFQTQLSNEGAQGGAIPGNSASTWDVNISALNTYLNGGKLVFFFNLNQTNSQTTTFLASPEDALGWMEVTLTNSTTHVSQSFLLDGNACTGVGGACDPTQAYPNPYTFPTADPSTNILPSGETWAYIHGQICARPDGSVLSFSACAPGDHTDFTVDQNLGANDAAFALYSNTLQTALDSGDFDVLSVDFRMAGLTNGYEQLLIYSSNAVPQDVPEPLTVTLFGAGLAGLGLLRRRRKA